MKPGEHDGEGPAKDFRDWYWTVSVVAGRLLSRLYPFKPPRIVFFFPGYNIGGATRVHTGIVEAVRDCEPWVVLTTFRSPDDRFLQSFRRSARVFDLAAWPFPKLVVGFATGFFMGLAGRRADACVFGCNSTPFYKALPHVGRRIRRIDLLHSVVPGEYHESIPCIGYLDQRVIINPAARSHLAGQYHKHGISMSFMDRVLLIENGVVVPGDIKPRGGGNKLVVVYVGRGSPEKRLYLIGRIAGICCRQGLPVTFELIGPEVSKYIMPEDAPYCTCRGTVADDAELVGIYERSDILIMTSKYEGFPMVIMEAMSHGVVPLVTEALGGISRHVHDGENGLLVDVESEDHIVANMVERLAGLVHDKEFLKELSQAAHRYAVTHFNLQTSQKQYRRLLPGVITMAPPADDVQPAAPDGILSR